jgi:WD40 repeat protein
MKGYPSKVSCLSWHPTRPAVASAGGADVVVWQLPNGKGQAQAQPLRQLSATVTALEWADDGEFLAAGDRSGRVCIWNHRGEPVYTLNFEHEITVLRWKPGGCALLIGDTSGGLHLLHRTSPLGPDDASSGGAA